MARWTITTLGVAAAVSAGFAGTAGAQVSTSAAGAPAEDNALRRDTVVVIGARDTSDAASLAGSVDLIDRSELQYEHVDDTLELFSKAPGVYFQRFNQGIINTDISIRGFAGDGASPHAKLLIDGVPSNLHSGASELDQLFPMDIESIQVFKGTSDPRYGTFNLAGNYSVTTRSDVDGGQVEATVGSYDAREVQGYAGFRTGDLEHSYFLGHRDTAGYRDHTDLQKFSASGRWFYNFDSDTSLGFITRFAGYEGDAPGYLTRDVARAQPRSSADFANQDGGKKRVEHYSLHFDRSFDADIDWAVKAYHQHFDNERWVRFSAAGSIQDRVDDQWHTGAVTTLNWSVSEQWRFSFGANAEHQDNTEQRFGTVGQTRERNPANVLRNWQFSFETYGAYVQIENQPSDLLRWNAAVRVDRLDGDFTQFDALGVGTPREIFDFGTIVQPKLNLFITPTDTVTLFANYGRSFQHPFGSDAFTTGATNARDVSINDGGEVGVQWQPMESVDLRVSYWRQDASNEFVVVDGTPQNVGETERSGFDVAANWRPTEALYLWGNFSAIDTSIEKTNSADSAFVGNELRGIADYVASLGVTYDVTSDWTARLHVDSQGDGFFNEANVGGQIGEFTLVSIGADRRFGWGNLSLQVNNLFDEYFEYGFDFSQDGTDTIHSPFDGINGSVSLRVDF